METGRSGYGFEIMRDMCRKAQEQMLTVEPDGQMTMEEI